MAKEVTTKEYWDQYWGAGESRYPNYDKSSGFYHAFDLLLTECVTRTEARIGHRPMTFVDCGCGEGLILRFVHEQHPQLQLWGIEYSDAIEKARRMGQELGYDFHLIRGDLFEVCRPGGPGPFDMLISAGLIEHFEDPGRVLAQLTQMVAPGGCVITIIPNFDGLFNALWKLYDPANYGYHVPISNARLLEAHQKLGLENVSFHTIGTPSFPGITDATLRWQKMFNWVLVQINGRILRRIWPRQASLTRRYPMTPAVACIGWKPATGSPDIRETPLQQEEQEQHGAKRQ